MVAAGWLGLAPETPLELVQEEHSLAVAAQEYNLAVAPADYFGMVTVDPEKQYQTNLKNF